MSQALQEIDAIIDMKVLELEALKLARSTLANALGGATAARSRAKAKPAAVAKRAKNGKPSRPAKHHARSEWWKSAQGGPDQCDKHITGKCTGAIVRSTKECSECNYAAWRCTEHGGAMNANRAMGQHLARHRRAKQETTP